MISAVNLPDVGIGEVEVVEIMVSIGENIVLNQSLIVIEGDKSSIEVPSPLSGIVKSIAVNVGDKLVTGSLIMMFEIIDDNVASTPEISGDLANLSLNDKGNVVDINSNINKSIHATPLVYNMARELGIDLNHVKGTGRKGRILREDIYSFIKKNIDIYNNEYSYSIIGNLINKLNWPNIDFNKFGETESVELNRIQKISSFNLYRNWIMIPHVTQFDEADITETEEFRKQQNINIKHTVNVKIRLIVFIMKAVAKSLEQWPRFNSSLLDDGYTLILKKYINIGIAINTVHGLLVPVFRDVNKKSIIDLSCELTEMINKSVSGKELSPSDMQGGCFTISSLGKIGGTGFTPIINAPEVAILGIAKSSVKPIWNGEKFIPRLILPLSLSYDHRVINGVDGAKFISCVKNIISDIRLLIM